MRTPRRSPGLGDKPWSHPGSCARVGRGEEQRRGAGRIPNCWNCLSLEPFPGVWGILLCGSKPVGFSALPEAEFSIREHREFSSVLEAFFFSLFPTLFFGKFEASGKFLLRRSPSDPSGMFGIGKGERPRSQGGTGGSTRGHLGLKGEQLQSCLSSRILWELLGKEKGEILPWQG